MRRASAPAPGPAAGGPLAPRGRRRRLGVARLAIARRRGLAALLLLLAPLAAAQDGGFLAGATLRGEVGVDTGVGFVHAAGATTASVPLRIVARLELDAPLAPNARARAVLLPSLAAGSGAAEPRIDAGLQEAFVRVRTGDVDLSAGYERLPLTEMRLLEPVSVEGRASVEEPRGPLGARAAWYAGAWRLRAAALAVSADDLAPDGPGAAVSVRHEASALTWEAHALWTVRPAAGATLSASVGDVVAYGEAWLLADPWTGRGGAGVTGYAGDWLWTAEAGLAAPAGDLRGAAVPTLAGSASRAFGLDAALDATLRLSWPASAADPAARATVADAALSWRHDVGDASLTLVPALRVGEGRLSGALGLSLRGYF